MRRRPSPLLAVTCGCLGVVLVLGVLGVAGIVGAKRPATVSGTCGAGSFQVTLTTGPGDASQEVTAHVVIYDRAARTWDLFWRGYGYGVVELDTDESPPVGQASALLGDLDNGDHRPVWIRPSGAKTWCKVDAHL